MTNKTRQTNSHKHSPSAPGADEFDEFEEVRCTWWIRGGLDNFEMSLSAALLSLPLSPSTAGSDLF